MPCEKNVRAARREGLSVFDASCGGVLRITDFVNGNMFIRQVHEGVPLQFSFEFHTGGGCTAETIPEALCENALAVTLREGSVLYEIDSLDKRYVTCKPYYMVLKAIGGEIALSDKTAALTIGKGEILCAFSDNFESCLSAVEKHNPESALTAAKERGAAVLAGVKNVRAKKEFEDSVFQIHSQLSRQGGAIAGYNYHLAYIRDNYGVFRGLLSMGMYMEAKRLLDFFRGVFLRAGAIHNAHGMGADAVHIHENDDVEITAYLGLMPFDYAAETGESALLADTAAMIAWCVERQLLWLKRGMLPFNGDETYIAGGFLPRGAIYNGSLEATMLFHTLLKRIAENPAPFGGTLLAKCEAASREIERYFEANFIHGGGLKGNCPDYMKISALPNVRHGVRECGHGFGYSYKNGAGRYVCRQCFDTFLQPPENILYDVPAVCLMQYFVKGELVPKKYLDPYLKGIAKKLQAGYFDGAYAGYEPALILKALKDGGYGGELIKRLAERVAGLRDSAGMWSEYYAAGRPAGTLCRPWESGISVSALLEV
jgi:hypothetical protein